MKIIFFSSHTATWYFAIAEATLAHALQKIGHQVLFVTPGNLFKNVSSKGNEKILRDEFGLMGYEIGSVLSKDMLKKIDLTMSKLTKNNFEDLEIDGIKIGKIALYEFLLNHKKMTPNLNDDEWKMCFPEIKNSLISYYACREILAKEKPDRVLMYNALYSVNHVWEKYSEKVKIPVYFLHHGLNLSDMDNTLIVAKKNMLEYLDGMKSYWPKFKNKTISKNQAAYVTDHFLEIIKGRHQLVYSSAKSTKKTDIRKIFGIASDQKILLATMSSYDEMFAAEYVGGRKKYKSLLFTDQSIWIKSLINYVKGRNDLFLIVRVHPREFPNKRESVKSEHAMKLEKIFAKTPRNVVINWPSDNISIYDIANEVSVILNAWSTVGVEMSLLGIPVVTYAKELISYPSDLNYVPRDRDDYFQKIELALTKGRGFNKVKLTYRWLSLFYNLPIIRLRKKKIVTISKPRKNYISNFTNFIYSNLPIRIRSRVVNAKRLRLECKDAVLENIDIKNVDKMLTKNTDTLVQYNITYGNDNSKDIEDVLLKNEIRKLYKLLNFK